MDLLPAPWEEGGTSPLSAAPPSAGATRGGGRIPALVAALGLRRQSREVGLQLRAALRDASAEFAYVRLMGLQRLLRVLKFASLSLEAASILRESQLYPELQIMPVILEHCLGPMTNGGEREGKEGDGGVGRVDDSGEGEAPGGREEEEVVAGLKVVEGACLLDPSSRTLAAHLGAIKVVMDALQGVSTNVGVSAALDALLAILVDSPHAVKELEELKGVVCVMELLVDRRMPQQVRLKSAEFLVLLNDQVFSPMAERGMVRGREALLDEVGRMLGAVAAAALRSPSAVGIPLSAESLQSRVHQFFDAIKLL